jgi:3'-5' exonuclease
MSTLIFDIETVGEAWEDLDSVTQNVLTRWIQKTARSTSDQLALLTDVKNGLGISPCTGKVVALGLYDLERNRGVVYYTGVSGSADEVVGEYVYKQRSETELLSEFWEGVRSYDTFVTFNGRCFDVPFLVHRSLAHAITPSRNLLEGRYPYQQKTCRHVDLQDELTFFGAMQRRPSLHLLCRAYGVKSPKIGVKGDDVTELFKQKQFREIAEYNAGDVTATTELYQIWRKHLGTTPDGAEIDF